MPKVKTPLRLEAERLCTVMPDAPTKTLARRLADEFGVPIEQARSTLRTVRGASGTMLRKKSTGQTPRTSDPEQAKAPRIPPTQLPESLAEEWVPFELDGAERVLVLSDLHVPYHITPVVEAAIKYGKANNPDVIMINGDGADFYSISRHQKDPRKRNFKAELEAVRQFLRYIREQFPKARLVYKYGNHEERFDHWLWNHAPEVSDCEEMLLSTWMQFADIGWEWVDEQRPVLAGKLPIFHGHELGRSGIASPVNPARGAFLRTHHTVLVGHSHQTSGHADTNVWHEETFVWSTGCLCDLNPSWNRINRWNWGFAVVEIDGDGFQVSNMRISRDFKARKS